MKNLTNKLHTLTTNKVEIKNLQNINTNLVSEVLPLLREEAKKVKAGLVKEYTKQGKKDITIPKSVTLARLKKELDSKEPVIVTALNIMIEKLEIDYTLSLAKLNKVITLVRSEDNKVFTKTSVNKMSNEQLVAALLTHDKANKVLAAKQVIKEERAANKAANTPVKKDTAKTA